MAFSARARPKGRRSHSAPPGLHTTALRLDSTDANGGVDLKLSGHCMAMLAAAGAIL